jgi:hypothetical protein
MSFTFPLDLLRCCDLFYQGLIDALFIGREVETDWKPYLKGAIAKYKKPGIRPRVCEALRYVVCHKFDATKHRT